MLLARASLTLALLAAGTAAAAQQPPAALPSPLDRAKAAMAKGDDAAALEALNASIAESAAPGREAVLAESYRMRGRVLDGQARFQEALDDLQRYRALAEDLGDRPGVAGALASIAHEYQTLGDIELARSTAGESLEIGDELDDPVIQASALNTLGIINEVDGNYRVALEDYTRALALRRAQNNTLGMSRALMNIGNVYSAQGNYPLALEQYDESLALAHAAGSQASEALVYITIGNAYGRAGDYALAIEYLEKSLNAARSIHNDTVIAYATLDIAEARRLQLRLDEADAAYAESIREADALGHKGLRAANALGLGKLRNAQQRYGEALAAAQRALTLAGESGERETVWEAQAVAGLAYRALEQDEQAAASFTDAIANIETIRTNIAGGEEESARSFETKILPYHAMVDLLIDERKPADALAMAERAKGRVLLDVLHSGRTPITKAMTPEERDREHALGGAVATLNRDLQHATGADADGMRAGLVKARQDYESFHARLYVSHPELRAIRAEAKTMSLAGTRDLLPDERTVLLEYVVMEQKTYLFAITRPHGADDPVLECFTIGITRKELGKLAEGFRAQLARRDVAFRASARRLYDLLLKPAAAQLAGRGTAIVVPESVLWNLPFQALVSPANRYAVEDHAFSYAPSLTVLREMARSRAARTGGAQTLLAVGNPASALAPLPDAENQVRTLSRLYGRAQSEVLTGTDAGEDRVKKDAGTYRIVHLATHGVFDDASPMHSYVLLAQGAKSGGEDGLLEAREIMDLDLRADLVVLSACETARGHIGDGEGVMGLTWAFFVAGAPATVVSQWKVESSSTTALMLAFHRSRLGPQASAAQPASTARALQRAMVGLLRGEGPYRHPFYWAGFVVVGDGR